MVKDVFYSLEEREREKEEPCALLVACVYLTRNAYFVLGAVNKRDEHGLI